MASSFPGGLDSFTNPTSGDDLSDSVGGRTHSAMHADVNDAVEAVQAELGTNPSGSESTVGARFTAVEGDVSTLQSAVTAAQGDITVVEGDLSDLTATVAALPGGASYVFDVVAYGAEVDGSTDDTAAWQDAIDAAAAAGGGVVTSSLPGVSVIAGALQDTGAANAQLTLPAVDYADSEAVSIVIRGPFSHAVVPSVIGSTPVPDNALVLKSTLSSGSGAMLGAYGPGGTFANFTNVHVTLEDLVVALPSNPTNTALDLRRVATLRADNLVVHAGSLDVDGLTEPTTTTSYGLRAPGSDNGASVYLGTVHVVGFYTGMEFAEHTVGLNVSAWGCNVGAEFDATNHASVFLRYMAVHCKYGMKFTGAHAVDVWQYDIEHASSGWNATTYDIDDASDYGLGFVRWWVVLGGTGPDDTFTVNGAAGITTSRVGAAIGSGGGGAGYVHRDRLVAPDASTGLLLGATPIANSPLLWIDSVIQWPTVDYAITGDTITFTDPLTAGDVVTVQYHSADSYAAAILTNDSVDIEDDFNRSDSTSSLGTTSVGGALWVQGLGTWGITSNKAYQSGATEQINHAYVDAGLSDVTVSAAITPNAGGAQFYGICGRLSGPGSADGIFVQYNTAGTIDLFKRVGGTNTTLDGPDSYTPTAGDVLELVMAGSSLTVKVNGSTVLTATDSAHSTNTKHGLWDYKQNACHFDDFSIQP